MKYEIITPRFYLESSGAQQVLFSSNFLQLFDIVKGIDYVPFDKGSKTKKNHWWVCPKSIKDSDINDFINPTMPGTYKMPVKEFKTVEEAVAFVQKWTKNYLEAQLLNYK